MLNIGIIGCGVVGTCHAEEINKHAAGQVAACCDLNREAAAKLAADIGVERIETEAQALFDDPGLDAVVIGLPTGFRFPLAEAALRAGKHVLLEKPVAMHADEVRRLQAVQGEAVVACCSSRMSLMPRARAAQRLIADGALGELRSIHAWAMGPVGGRPEKAPPPWRVSHRLNGGGLCMNWGVYDLDFLLGLFAWQLKPVQVFAQCWGVADCVNDRVAPASDAETHLMVSIRFAGGAMLQLERGEFCAGPPRAEWQLTGSEAAIDMHLYEPTAPVKLHRIDPDTGVREETPFHDPDDDTFFMNGPASDFIEAISEGRPPQTGLSESLQLATITDAIYTSSHEGRCVDLG